MSDAPEPAEPQQPTPMPERVQINRDEVLARARQHPVAGPYVEVIIRDLMMEALAEELRQTREQLAAAKGGARPRPPASTPRPGAKPRSPRKPPAE